MPNVALPASDIKVHLTEDQELLLWKTLHASRSTSATIKVDRAALEAILMDYGTLVEALGRNLITPEGTRYAS